MNKKVLIIAYHYSPSNNGGVARPVHLAKYLPLYGWEPVVLSCGEGDDRGPSGETINITRMAREGTADDFIALSSTCPHLGCQVRWEGQNDRFFCPCHNGVFDPSGKGIEGPPGDAGQSLPRYSLRIDDGLLHIAVPPPRFAAGTDRAGIIRAEAGIAGPGHDPCLDCDDPRAAERESGEPV